MGVSLGNKAMKVDIPLKHLEMLIHLCPEHRAYPVTPLVIYEDIQFLQTPP